MKNTIEKLTTFVNRKPGLEFANYGDRKTYFSEMRKITKDRSDYFELLGLAFRRVQNLEEQLIATLSQSSGRLSMNDKGEIEYCTGQYFPAEYRSAACSVLRSIIWNSYMNEKREDGSLVYPDGDTIRKAIWRNLSRRCGKRI